MLQIQLLSRAIRVCGSCARNQLLQLAFCASLVMEGSLFSSSAGRGNEASLAAAFECNICTEFPSEPFAITCGHVLCCPCIYRWIQNGPKPCPISRTVLKETFNIFPLEKTMDAEESDSIPRRPTNSSLFISKRREVGDRLDCTQDCKPVMGVMNSGLEQVTQKRVRMLNLAKNLNDLQQFNSIVKVTKNRVTQSSLSH